MACILTEYVFLVILLPKNEGIYFSGIYQHMEWVSIIVQRTTDSFGFFSRRMEFVIQSKTICMFSVYFHQRQRSIARIADLNCFRFEWSAANRFSKVTLIRKNNVGENNNKNRRKKRIKNAIWIRRDQIISVFFLVAHSSQHSKLCALHIEISFWLRLWEL